MNVNCLFCGNQFQTTRQAKLYCNRSCKNKAYAHNHVESRREDQRRSSLKRQVLNPASKLNRLKKRQPIVNGNRARVPLNDNLTKFCFVDASDLVLLAGHIWYEGSGGYAKTQISGRSVFMHRLLIAAPAHLQVDHIDCDKLNNRRSNLRLATAAENRRNKPKLSNNKSGYKGVTQCAYTKWEACIRTEGKTVHIGVFDTKEEAARAYDGAAIFVHGEFAHLNFKAQTSHNDVDGYGSLVVP